MWRHEGAHAGGGGRSARGKRVVPEQHAVSCHEGAPELDPSASARAGDRAVPQPFSKPTSARQHAASWPSHTSGSDCGSFADVSSQGPVVYSHDVVAATLLRRSLARPVLWCARSLPPSLPPSVPASLILPHSLPPSLVLSSSVAPMLSCPARQMLTGTPPVYLQTWSFCRVAGGDCGAPR